MSACEEKLEVQLISWATLYCALHKLKVRGNPVLSKTIGAIFSYSICSLYISLSHFSNSHKILNFFIIISVVVIREQGSVMLLL